MSAVPRHHSRAGSGIVATLTAGILAAGVAASPALAMGTGNPYEDMQVGVTYTVYQPANTLGVKTPTAPTQFSECPAGVDEVLFVKYRKSGSLQFTVTEGNPICADIGSGPVVLTTTIDGRKARVIAYCDPASSAPCKVSDVKRYGGHLEVVLPAAPGLRKTTVWIETPANRLTAQQLVTIGKSLDPVE